MRISDWSSDVCSSDLIVEGAAGVLAADAEQCPLVLAGPGKGEAQVLARRFQLRVELQGPVEVDDRRLGIAPQQVGEAAVIVEHRGLAVDGERTVVGSDRLIPLAGAVVQQDRKSTRLNSSHYCASRMPSSA